MKDYEEMAKSVLNRRDVYVAERKKHMKKLVSIGSCFCLILLVSRVALRKLGREKFQIGQINIDIGIELL